MSLKRTRAGSKKFSARLLATINEANYLKVRSGSAHRFTAIWCVVAGGSVYVRSWYMRPQGWFFSFLEQPLGSIDVKGREVRVRARHVRSDRVKNAVSRAYAEKYVTPASLKYVRGFARGRRRGATLELRPR